MPTKDPARDDKFVVRFDSAGVRAKVSEKAAENHTSMNSFILQAIDEKLARGARIDRLLDAAERDLI